MHGQLNIQFQNINVLCLLFVVFRLRKTHYFIGKLFAVRTG